MSNVEKSIYQLVKKKMRELRKDHKLTQLDVANKLGVTVQHYQQIESGNTPPNLRIIIKMCEVFDVHPSYFFNDDNVTVVDKDGQVVIEDLYINDVMILQSTGQLSPEAKKSIMEYIRFKHFEEMNRQEE